MAHCSHFGLGGLVCLSWRKKRPPRCLTDLMDHVFFKQSTCFLSWSCVVEAHWSLLRFIITVSLCCFRYCKLCTLNSCRWWSSVQAPSLGAGQFSVAFAFGWWPLQSIPFHTVPPFTIEVDCLSETWSMKMSGCVDPCHRCWFLEFLLRFLNSWYQLRRSLSQVLGSLASTHRADWGLPGTTKSQ